MGNEVRLQNNTDSNGVDTVNGFIVGQTSSYMIDANDKIGSALGNEDIYMNDVHRQGTRMKDADVAEPSDYTYKVLYVVFDDYVVDHTYQYYDEDALTVPACTLTIPARTYFSKWNSLATGLGTSYSVGASLTPTADMLIYAIFVDYTYSVSYNANTGTGTVATQYFIEDALTINDGSGLTPPEGKVFSKWNTTAEGDGDDVAGGASYSPTDDVTLYAVWVDDGE